ncbi:unnamed protein product [Candidula unifasciata]|uniref:DALR anticodon binding domain-containing protein n=1 Tax=Candidula unifasciata TaxID=100452 RepID=A0A8S3Z4A0_9EUPU|nr:unnamed protein product [Candidula unifasciata]
MADSIVSRVFQELERIVQGALVRVGLNEEKNHVKLIKKTRHLKSGDVFIPTGILRLNDAKKTEILEFLEQSSEKLKEKFIKKVFADKFSILTFHLDRVQFCRAVFKEVQDLAGKYGHTKKKINTSVYINAVNKEGADGKNSLTDLRLEVTRCHVQQLLAANGYLVSQTVHNDSNLVLGTTKVISTENTCEETVRLQTSELERRFMEKARLLALSSLTDEQQQKRHVHGEASASVTGCTVRDGDTESTVILDVEQMSLNNQQVTEGEGLVGNIGTVTVVRDGKPTYILKEAIRLAEFLENKQCCYCVHVVPQNQVFTQQQILLTLAALSDQQYQQSLLVVGPVVAKHAETADSKLCIETADAFYERRLQQMKDASEIRNGCESSDHRQIELLTSASIKLDLLANTCHNSLHLDASSTDCGAESRMGAFVLYNVARLATLMSRFNQSVQKGIYPPLPPLEDIDLNLLREEEDWELVYLYVAAFPDVLRQSVEEVFPKDGKYLAKIHTHKVTSFIIALTKCVSAHYSRYHVLTGGESHLLPLMYARLYLLKSVHQVSLNSLQLVGVEALSFL